LKTELKSIKKDYNSLMLEKNDQNDACKTKLVTVLDRLNQLEAITN